jgi:hypothetical protein
MKRVIFRAFTVWIILVMVYNLKNYCGYEWYLEPFPFWKEYGYWFLEKPGYWPKNPSPSYYALCGKDPFNLPVFGYLFVFVAISGLQWIYRAYKQTNGPRIIRAFRERITNSIRAFRRWLVRRLWLIVSALSMALAATIYILNISPKLGPAAVDYPATRPKSEALTPSEMNREDAAEPTPREPESKPGNFPR